MYGRIQENRAHFIPVPICFGFHLVDFLVNARYDVDELGTSLPYTENQNW